ncbi:acetate--CoA ligase family protein [Chloroflexota bacterium]
MKAEQLKQLECVFNPRAVAVIGASQDDSFTHVLMNTKMRDNLFLVNPKYKEVLGKKCYTSILDIEGRVDYAIIAVPAFLVLKVLNECIEKGVNAAHIFTAGFSETGLEERIRLENEVKEAVKGGIRLIGPNCMGIYCPKSGLSFIPDASTEEGPVGVISQSGTFAELFISIGKTRNFKLSKVISYGNAIDLDCPDFLEYLADDPETKIIALYIEGTRDGERLKSTLGKAARKKPVVALKGGVTKDGNRAASSHTGSLAGSPEIWSSLFKQTGVVQVEDFDELVDSVLALTYSPLLSGKGVSIITNSGGFSVMETDLCVKAGLEVPQFEEETMRQLREMVPIAGTSIANPLDAYPIYYNIPGTSGTVSDAIKIVALDKNIHSLMLHFDELKYMKHVWGEALEGRLKELVNAIANACDYVRDEIGKPVMACVLLDVYSEDEEDRKHHLMVKEIFESKRFPVYSSLDASVKALFNLYRYGTQSHNE